MIMKMKRKLILNLVALLPLLLAPLVMGNELPEELGNIPASRFCKPVEDTESPDGRFAIAVGFKSPEQVDWARYKAEEGDYFIDTQNEPPLFANFLIDLKKDRAFAVLKGKHFGTRRTYNHESCQVAWSEKGGYLVEMQSWKWHTSSGMLYRLDASGAISSRLDLLELASKELARRMQDKHRVDPKDFDARYATSLSEPEISDAGKLTLQATAQVPKSDDTPSISLAITFVAKADERGELKAAELVVKEEE